MGNVTQYYRALNRGGGGGLLYTPPLDLYSAGIFAALSPTRKLRTLYTGPAVRIVDPVTSVEYDVPFKINGEVDQDYVQALSVSLNRRFRCVLIYDQSGNGNNAICSANGFYTDGTSGVFNKYTLNGKPVLSRCTSSIATASFTNNSEKSFFCVGASIGAVSNSRHLSTRVASTGWLYRDTNIQNAFIIVGGASVTVTVSNPVNTQYLSGFTHNASQLARLYKNGALLGSGTAGGGTNGGNLTNINVLVDEDWFQERLIYLADKTADAIAIQTNLNAYYGTY